MSIASVNTCSLFQIQSMLRVNDMVSKTQSAFQIHQAIPKQNNSKMTNMKKIPICLKIKKTQTLSTLKMFLQLHALAPFLSESSKKWISNLNRLMSIILPSIQIKTIPN